MNAPDRPPEPRTGSPGAERDRILGRVRDALAARPRVARPGDFGGWRPEGSLDVDPLRAFAAAFTAAGGEAFTVTSMAAAADWLEDFATGFDTAATGATVPAPLRPARPAAPSEAAALGVSLARAAVAETGSLVLDARDGRRSQILPPTHLVWVRAENVHATLGEALDALRPDLTSAVGLHSGPSKSADIGQILVRGVHGPGRVVAGIIHGREP